MAWPIVGLLSVVAALNYLDRIMVTTMRDSLTAAIPMTDAQFGLLTSVFLWVYGLLSPFAGFLADRFSRSRLIIGSLLIWSLLTWLTGHARSFEELMVVRALMGASEAAYLPAALALIADYHRGPTRSLATGVHMMGLSVGSALGGAGGWLAERHGWSAAFDVFGLFGIGYALVLVLMLKDAPRETAEVGSATVPQQARLGEALRSLFGSGAFLLLLAFWSLLGVAGWAVIGWMPTYFKETFHLDQGAAGISATAYLYTAAMLGKLLGGAWADRWSRTQPRARILVPTLGLFIAAPAVLLVAQTSLLPLGIAGLSIYGLTRAFSEANLMPILCQISDPRYRATGYGVLNMFGTIVGGVTIYIGGAMRDAHVSVSTLFTIAAAGLLGCAVLLLWVKPNPTLSANADVGS
ncbi:MAG: MFS transporter [Verrucomicrobiota bacterium]